MGRKADAYSISGIDQNSAKSRTAPTDKLRRMLRQASGRYVSKFSLNGREKTRRRPLPSLPRVSCLERPLDLLQKEDK